jgi:small subunit ribosomal protein S16
MVRIRLRRIGSKAQPSYRIVAADREAPRDGRFLEILGHYNPRTEPATIDLKEDRIYDWIGKGAQPSDSVLQLFKTRGVMERYARFKAGEPVETLLEEAAKAAPAVNAKTTREGAPAKKAKKSEKAAE